MNEKAWGFIYLSLALYGVAILAAASPKVETKVLIMGGFAVLFWIVAAIISFKHKGKGNGKD